MKVSIITVCFNSEATIRDTFNSINNQTYKNIEHIIVDGASTDATVKIVNECAGTSNLKIISEKDNGIYDAMNKGIKMATGDIISILNSDDVFNNNNVLEDVVAAFKASEAAIIYGDLYYVSKNDINKIIRYWKSSAYKEHAFLKGWHPPHPTLFIKKEVYNKYGLFDKSLTISSDFELMLRFIEKLKVKTLYINKVLVRMRVGGISNKSLKNIFFGNINIKKAFVQNGLRYKFYYPAFRLLPKLFQFIKK